MSPLLLLILVFIAGAVFGALVAFMLASRSYHKGYADALSTMSQREAPVPTSAGQIDIPS